VILRPRADLDIDHQFEYLAVEAGLATARRFMKALRRTCGSLQENPELGSARTFGNRRLAGLRVWPVKGFRRHLIFYIPSAKAIEIVRVLHGARDLLSLLGDK
jgi:toxin ParE1/3/4